MKKKMKRFLPSWKVILSGILITLSAPPFDFDFLIWVAFLPWFFELHSLLNKPDLSPQARLFQLLLQSLWLSYFQSIGCLYWLSYAVQEFGNLPRWLSVLILQGGCFTITEPQYWVVALVLGLVSLKQKQPLLLSKHIFFIAFLYSTLDSLVPKLFLDTVGHFLYAYPRLRQLTELGGPPLLTFFILLVNGVIFRFYLEVLSQKKKKQLVLTKIFPLSSLTALLLVLLGILWGNYRLKEVQTAFNHAQRKIQVALIQGNIGDIQKVAAERGIRQAAIDALQIFIDLSEKALSLSPQPELIIWPETSYPTVFGKNRSRLDQQLTEMLQAFIQKNAVPLLFGGYDQEKNQDYNAFLFLEPSGNLQVYRKHHLLPFGEYIPFLEGVPWVTRAFPQMGDFGKGQGALTYWIQTPLQRVAIGPIICYESLVSKHSLKLAQTGSQILTMITNDSWFGPWAAPHLHLALASFRSIETRLPLVRNANTGISALILPDGSIQERSALNEPAILNLTVPLTVIPRLPLLDHSVFLWISLLALGFFIVPLFIQKKGSIL